MTGPKYPRMKIENADRYPMKPCASLRYAEVVLAKSNASITTDRWSAICKQWFAWEHWSLEKKFLPLLCSVCQRVDGMIVVSVVV